MSQTYAPPADEKLISAQSPEEREGREWQEAVVVVQLTNWPGDTIYWIQPHPGAVEKRHRGLPGAKERQKGTAAHEGLTAY